MLREEKVVLVLISESDTFYAVYKGTCKLVKEILTMTPDLPFVWCCVCFQVLYLSFCAWVLYPMVYMQMKMNKLKEVWSFFSLKKFCSQLKVGNVAQDLQVCFFSTSFPSFYFSFNSLDRLRLQFFSGVQYLFSLVGKAGSLCLAVFVKHISFSIVIHTGLVSHYTNCISLRPNLEAGHHHPGNLQSLGKNVISPTSKWLLAVTGWNCVFRGCCIKNLPVIGFPTSRLQLSPVNCMKDPDLSWKSTIQTGNTERFPSQ